MSFLSEIGLKWILAGMTVKELTGRLMVPAHQAAMTNGRLGATHSEPLISERLASHSRCAFGGREFSRIMQGRLHRPPAEVFPGPEGDTGRGRGVASRSISLCYVQP